MVKRISLKRFLLVYSLSFSIPFLILFCLFNKEVLNESDISQEQVKPRYSQQGLVIEGSDAVMPVDRAMERVSKKPYGIYVSPNNSPVQPERFSGYHTASDFEILADEEDLPVLVYAICEAELKYQGIVNGYGGVMILACDLNGEAVTLIYGHLDIKQLDYQVGDKINKGDQIAILAPAYSDLSDGERKHLHLGIHRGEKIELRGYVSSESELLSWYDPMLLLLEGAF